MIHDLGAAPPSQRSNIILAARALPPGPRGERRYYGNLRGRDWSVNVQLSVGRGLERVPMLLGAVRILTLVGRLDRDQYARMTRYIEGAARGDVMIAGNAAWTSYNKIIEHPATATILSALSAVPGVGQFTSTAYLAAKAVGAIGQDLTTAKRSGKKSGYTAKNVAQAANQALAANGKTIRIAPADIERAVKAYFAMQAPKKARIRINFLQKQPLSPTSAEYRELLALQFADQEGPGIELTPESLDPIPAYSEVSGGLSDTPCRCHVWSDTAGDLSGFGDPIGADDLLAGIGDSPSDLVDIPELPDVAQMSGPMDSHDVAGPDDGDLASTDELAGPLDEIGGPAESFDLGGPMDEPFDRIAGPAEGIPELAGPMDDIETSGAFDSTPEEEGIAGPAESIEGVGGSAESLDGVGPMDPFDDALASVSGPAESLAGLAGPDDGADEGDVQPGLLEGVGGPMDPFDDPLASVRGPEESLADLAGPGDGADEGDVQSGLLEPDLTPIAGPPPDAADLSMLDSSDADTSGAPDGLEFGDGFDDAFAHRPGAFIGATFEPWSYDPPE